MKLSIITINLNNREGLQRTIDSVVCQTFRDFEWIVIDGGSTDGSKELIEQYADHFAYWVSEPDKGIYNAMNKGIKVANGEYLQFLNSGDWLWEENSLETAFSYRSTADVIYTDVNNVNNGIIIETRRFSNEISLTDYLGSGLCHNSTFFKKSFIIKNKYNEKYRIASDIELFIKAILLNCRFEHIPIVLIGFDTTGIGSTNIELGEKESREIKETLISPLIMRDIHALKHLTSLTSNKVLCEVESYRENYPLYHKMITCSLLFMRIFKKIFKN